MYVKPVPGVEISPSLYDFDIPETTLSNALHLLAVQTDKTLVAPAEIVAGKKTRRLRQELTLAQALAYLLQDNEIAVQITQRAILLTKRPTSLAASKPVATPPTGKGAPQNRPIDNIVVTGYRNSLNASQNHKRSNVVQSEAIYAQDIADFPELNLGDALQRLPGLVAERDNGATRQLGLRGLGPNFVRVRINGIESLATFNSVFDHRGSAARTRNFDFNIFAAELFSTIEVEKTYRATQDEGGIAGTINLITPRPFDFKTDKAAFNVQSVYNDGSNAFTPRLSLLLSKRYQQNGVLFSVAYSQTENTETGFRDWGWRTFTRSRFGPKIAPETQKIVRSGKLVGPTVASYTHVDRSQSRLGVTSAWQWQQDERLSLGLTGLFAQVSSQDSEFNLVSQNAQQLTDITFTQDNTVVFAEFDHADIRSEAKISKANTAFFNLNALLDAKFSESVRLTASLGASGSHFSSPVHDKVFLQATGIKYSVDFRPRQRVPSNIYAADLTLPSTWTLHRADVREDDAKNAIYNANIQLNWDLDHNKTVVAGIQAKQFESEGFERRDDVRNLNALAIPFASYVHASPLNPPYVVANVDATLEKLLAHNLTGRVSRQPFSRKLNESANRAGTAFDLQEKTLALFGAYQFGFSEFRGDIGLRWLRTQTVSQGDTLINAASSGAQAEFLPTRVENAYEEWLPAVNLVWDMNDNLTFRVSASRNLSRPGIDDLRTTANVSIPNNRVGKGNPALRPFLAKSFDMGAEYYFGELNYLGLALYYKDLDSYIVNRTELVTFAELNLPKKFLTQDREGELFSLSQPINGDGGRIKGAELSLQFEAMPGVGVLANYTFSQGNTDYLINGEWVNASLLNLSKHTYNLTLYAETEKGGGRLSAQYRDRYLNATDNINQFIGINQQQVFDASVYWNVNSTTRLTLEVLNLTNEPIDVFANPAANRPMVYTRSGRTYLLGLRMDLESI